MWGRGCEQRRQGLCSHWAHIPVWGDRETNTQRIWCNTKCHEEEVSRIKEVGSNGDAVISSESLSPDDVWAHTGVQPCGYPEEEVSTLGNNCDEKKWHFIQSLGLIVDPLKWSKDWASRASWTEIHSPWKANLQLVICFCSYWNLKYLLYQRWLKTCRGRSALETQCQLRNKQTETASHDESLTRNNSKLWVRRLMGLNSWRQMMPARKRKIFAWIITQTPRFIAPDSAIVCLGNRQPVSPGTGWGARVFVKLGVLWLCKMNQARIYT